MSENCYFWTDDSIPTEERKVSVLCEQCHLRHPEIKGWFWEGSRLGYGPFDFICNSCGFVVHSAPKENS